MAHLSLKKKGLEEILEHPAPAEVKEESLFHVPISKVRSYYFNDITEIMVVRAESLTKGSGDQFLIIFAICYCTKCFKQNLKI